MGMCLSSEAKESRQRSHAIDKMIREESEKEPEFKILLLGTGESGKSTIVKQMKIIHKNGFTKEELLAYRLGIFRNIVDTIKDVIRGVQRLGYKFAQPGNEVFIDIIMRYQVSTRGDFAWDSKIVDIIESLWNDPVVPTILDCTSQVYVMDQAPHFFRDLRRIASPDYVPTEEDVLRGRIKTTGITQTKFQLGKLHVNLVDVGGQRSERRKWIYCFADVSSVLFVVALNEYDQVLIEDPKQNRMAESLVLFESIVNSRWFRNCSIILFLNKIDLFRNKIKRIPLETFFPNYMDGPDTMKAAKFVLKQFVHTNRADLSIYPHFTQATDTSNIRKVFAAVKHTLLKNSLNSLGVM